MCSAQIPTTLVNMRYLLCLPPLHRHQNEYEEITLRYQKKHRTNLMFFKFNENKLSPVVLNNYGIAFISANFLDV